LFTEADGVILALTEHGESAQTSHR